jgi:nucleotide-binding universal stress UspA family protein
MDSPAFRRILVPIDGSASGKLAVDLALRLADGGGSIVFAHVINRAAVIAECVTPYAAGDPTLALGPLEDDEAELFKNEMQRAAESGIPATTLSLDGVTYDEIARAARDQHVDAIVMGTRGLGGLERLFVGSTADGVLRRSAVPTMVVRDGGHAGAGPLRCILAAVDESDTSHAAAHLAVNLAARDGGKVVFVHVAQAAGDDAGTVAVTSAQAYAHERGVHCETAVVHGNLAAEAIRISAEVCHADAIAVGTHGRRGFERLRLGSVAEALIRESAVPVIVVPQKESPAPDEIAGEPNALRGRSTLRPHPALVAGSV